jgi:phosphonate ABC transporter permease subunit PhnE
MLALIALPLGAGAGWFLTQQLMALGASVGDQSWVALVVLAAVLVVGWLLSRWGPAIPTEEGASGALALVIARFVALGLLALFGLGLAANLGNAAGTWLMSQLEPLRLPGLLNQLARLPFVLSNLLRSLSDAVMLLLAPAMGLLGGLIAASLGSRYGQEAVIRLEGLPARLLTVALTFGGGAVLIFGIGSVLNWLYLFDNPENWTTIPALIGGGAAALASLPVAPKHPFGIGAVIYTLSRSVLNVLRSIEPLIMAVVFVIWVGLGPFAGVMALTLHTIAALGKLYSEQIEGISEGPIEAITATGANRLQTIVYGVIPQIVPPYIAYTLYRWDINVRMSTIIGFVGGVGVGFLLSQSIRLLRYRDASVMMLAIAIVVSALDYISSRVRQRII